MRQKWEEWRKEKRSLEEESEERSGSHKGESMRKVHLGLWMSFCIHISW